MKLITAVVKPHRLDEIKEALQPSASRASRSPRPAATAASAATPRSTGVPSTPWTSVPKIRIEVLAEDADAEQLIDVVVKAARTGKIGDGKVWSVPVETAIRVRTGERGPDAL